MHANAWLQNAVCRGWVCVYVMHSRGGLQDSAPHLPACNPAPGPDSPCCWPSERWEAMGTPALRPPGWPGLLPCSGGCPLQVAGLPWRCLS